MTALPVPSEEGKIIEADETLMGPREYEFQNDRGWVGKKGPGGKTKILTLVERGGRARSMVAGSITAKVVADFIFANADTKSRLMTDEARQYPRIGKQFARHDSVNHSTGEYARAEITTRRQGAQNFP